MNVAYRKILNFQFFLFFFVLISCKPVVHDYDWNEQQASSSKIKNLIDGYTKKIEEYSNNKSDSAIYYCHKLIAVYKRDGMSYGEFNTLTKLSEIYLLRGDALNAIYYHGEALKIMIKSNGHENNNPYFYIDMGNMLYQNKLPNQAIINYNKSIQIARRTKNSYAESVALNNIGLTYKFENNYDSACLFFNKSLLIRKTLLPILEAQNYLYLGKVHIYTKCPDSILYYHNKTIDALKRQKKISHQTVMSKTDLGYLEAIVRCDADFLMTMYYKQKGNYQNELKYLNSVNYQAIYIIKDQIVPAAEYLRMSQIYRKLNDSKRAILYADSSYALSEKIPDFETLIDAAKTLANLYKYKQPNKSEFYLSKAMQYTDSFTNVQLSDKKQSAKILLITTQTRDSIQYYQNEQNKTNALIKIQSVSITTLASLMLFLGLVLYFLVRRNKRLKEKYIHQMEDLITNLRNEDEKSLLTKSSLDNTFENLEVRLLNCLKEEKVYKQKNLSLANLSNMLETNVNYLSQLINNQLNTNYNDFINSYRIKEACRIMMNDPELKYSIDQVADMVGFNSRSTFYSTFKKFTGITPAFFQKNLTEILEQEDNYRFLAETKM